MKTLFTLFVLLFSSSVVAEKYNCAYNWNEEIKNNSFERKGEIFLKHNGVTEDILYEDDKFLYLGQLMKHETKSFQGVRITIIDKEMKAFRMIVLHDPQYDLESSDIINGKCLVTYN